MRAIGISLAFTLVAAAALAQQSTVQPRPTATKTFSSSADVAALLAKIKTEEKDSHHVVGEGTVSEPILQLAPYTMSLDYHAISGLPAPGVHERDAEIYHMIDGSATLTTGGKLVNERRVDANNLKGTSIEGGASRPVAKGDWIFIPENTPHWFSSINGPIVVMSMHVPRPVPAAALAQQPVVQPAPTAIKTFASSADVAALLAKIKSKGTVGQGTVSEPILQLAPYTMSLDYHAISGLPAPGVHERDAEIYYVIDGSATLMTGGKLVNELRVDANNLKGTSIEGGVSRPIAKGDWIFIPEKTPHWLSSINGPVVMMSLHVPRPVPAAR